MEFTEKVGERGNESVRKLISSVPNLFLVSSTPLPFFNYLHSLLLCNVSRRFVSTSLLKMMVKDTFRTCTA